MARKSHYEKLVDDVRQALRQLDHKHCETTEQAMVNDQTLSNFGLAAPINPQNYSYCICGGVCFSGKCSRCK